MAGRKRKVDAGSGEVAAPHSKTTVKRGGSLQVDRACLYLSTLSGERLGGLLAAIEEKMAELEVSPNRRAAPKLRKLEPHEAVTGSVGGILRFVVGATAADGEKLQALHAIVSARSPRRPKKDDAAG